MKILFKPVGIIAGLIAGLTAKKLFERLWTAIDDADPPAPDQRDVRRAKLITALALEGVVFSVVKGVTDHQARRAFAGATGRWPGEDPAEG